MMKLNYLANTKLIKIIFLVAIFACYWPIYSGLYALNDDWSFFSYDRSFLFGSHPQRNFYLLTGRPVYLIFGSILERIAINLELFNIVRIFSICALAATYILMIRNLQSQNIVSKLFFVAFVMLLPGTIVTVTWLTMMPFIFGMAASVFAYICARKAFCEKNYRFMLIAFIFQIISTFTYQPFSFAFLIPLYFDIVNSEESLIRRIQLLIGSFFISFIAFILYFLLQNYLVLPDLLKNPILLNIYNQLGAFKFELSNIPFGRLLNLISSKLFFLINPYSDFQKSDLYIWILLVWFFICTLIDFKKLIIYTSIFILFSLIALSPYYLSANGHSGYRVLHIQSILCICYFYSLSIFIVFQTNKIIVKAASFSLLLFLFSIVLMNQYSLILDSSNYYKNEYKYVRSKLDGFSQGGISVITKNSANQSPGTRILGNSEFFHNNMSDLYNSTWIIREILGHSDTKLIAMPQIKCDRQHSSPKINVYSDKVCEDTVLLINMNLFAGD